MEYLYTCFSILIVNLVWKTHEGENKSIVLLILFLVVVESLVDEGWWGGAVSLIKDQQKSHLFPAGISAETISLTNVVSTGYFYVLFL